MSQEDTLARILKGAEMMAATTELTLHEALNHIHEGDFERAYEKISVAQHKVGPLAAAQDALGKLADNMVVKAKDVQPGMALHGHGEVESAQVCGDHIHFIFVGEEEPSDGYHPQQELLVQMGEPGDD